MILVVAADSTFTVATELSGLLAHASLGHKNMSPYLLIVVYFSSSSHNKLLLGWQGQRSRFHDKAHESVDRHECKGEFNT